MTQAQKITLRPWQQIVGKESAATTARLGEITT